MTTTDQSLGTDPVLADSDPSIDGDETARDNNYETGTADYAYGTYKNRPVSDTVKERLQGYG